MRRNSLAVRAGVAVLPLALLLAACASRGALPHDAEDPVTEDPVTAVEHALDALHAAASAADGDRYFALFTADAVFLGTDATERWTIDEFRAYAEPHFSAGRGWTYTPRDRHVFIDATGTTAWFDERLDNENYGEVRGTGVLRRTGPTDSDGPGGSDTPWRIAQYNLAFPVPNDLAGDLVERIRAAHQ